jgi:NADH:ubiquinone oxidoreductase subunit 6 (subunit J)
MTAIKNLLHAWLRSIEAAFAHGHFHWTPGVITLLALIVLVLGGRAVRGTGEGGSNVGAIAAAAAVVGVAIAIVLMPKHNAAPTVVQHKTTIVQHVTSVPSHPWLSGWQLAVVCIVVAVAGLVAYLNRRSYS